MSQKREFRLNAPLMTKENNKLVPVPALGVVTRMDLTFGMEYAD
jgi:hypothetical protein